MNADALLFTNLNLKNPIAIKLGDSPIDKLSKEMKKKFSDNKK